ncbi:MAG TPA: hypothetical protein VK621_08140 [Bradyrhizobium sp.]|nr:hypothetical protein [Bradyrhizobium sp.]
MNEPDVSSRNVLSRNMDALKELQRVGWRQLADPALTIFERREIRNEIKQSEAELRSCLEMMSDRCWSRERPAQDDATAGFCKVEFRLLGGIQAAGRELAITDI